MNAKEFIDKNIDKFTKEWNTFELLEAYKDHVLKQVKEEIDISSFIINVKKKAHILCEEDKSMFVKIISKHISE